MTEGQIIDFSGENKNRSYDFWMKREARLQCLYVCKTLEAALKWRENFESFDRKIQQARDYWSDRLTGEMEKTLLGGKIRVERILEDYQ